MGPFGDQVAVIYPSGCEGCKKKLKDRKITAAEPIAYLHWPQHRKTRSCRWRSRCEGRTGWVEGGLEGGSVAKASAESCAHAQIYLQAAEPCYQNGLSLLRGIITLPLLEPESL